MLVIYSRCLCSCLIVMCHYFVPHDALQLIGH